MTGRGTGNLVRHTSEDQARDQAYLTIHDAHESRHHLTPIIMSQRILEVDDKFFERKHSESSGPWFLREARTYQSRYQFHYNVPH